MPIHRSAATEIRQLVSRLVGDDGVERDAASARLAVIGSRATGALARALEASKKGTAQAAILRTLDAIHDPHGVAPAWRFVDSPEVEVATSAIALLQRFLRYEDAALANAAFERLTAVTLDPTRPAPIRAAALEALSDLPAETTREVLRQLENDPNSGLRSAARPGGGSPETLAQITRASLCPEPHLLRALLEREGRTAPLAVLGRLVEMLREREGSETATPRRTEWQAARAAVHQTLADRGSRLALYDLRESLSAVPGPLPVGFLAALEAIGDASTVDEIAAAYLRARQARDPWWTEHLAAAFRQIVRRERLTRRSAALKRVITKYPPAAEEMLKRSR